MNILLILKKGDIALARDEVTSLIQTEGELIENLLLIDIDDISILERLSQSRRLIHVCFRCRDSELIENMKSYDWDSVVTSPFCVRGGDEKSLASYIWNRLRQPKVDLKNPDTTIEITHFGDEVIAGVILHEFDSAIQRKAHKRPFLHPSSLDPALARCMVNLSGAKEGTIYDPFCGSGGILIESALMGLVAKGSDIEQDMIEGCQKNLDYFRLDAQLYVTDALDLNEEIPYVVSDIPYLLNTKGKKEERDKLYKGIFTMLDRCVTKRCVVGMPADAEIPAFKNIKKKSEYIIPIHKSLSKKILVLERNIN